LTETSAEQAAGVGPEATQAEMLFGELHLRLLEQYGPPSTVVNEAHDIVHLSESASRYLHFVAGEPTANIMKAINPALQIELRTALFKAAQTNGTVKSSPQQLEVGGVSEIVMLEVQPMKSSDEAHGFFLVLFHKNVEESGQSATDTPWGSDITCKIPVEISRS
jgi:two-component system CheB/CheR fusion protein